MNTGICLVALAGPLVHIVMAWFAERPVALVRQLRLSRSAAALASTSSIVSTGAVYSTASKFGVDVTYGELGIGILLDPLSVSFALVIGVVGFVVLDYSQRYLSGDPSHASFMGRLHLTLGLATLLSYSGNVLQLVVLWSATSLALHRLLFYYRNRPKVTRTATQKFRMARVGDVLLAAGGALLYEQFGTGDLRDLAHAAAALVSPLEVTKASAAGLLLVAAASLKSGQVPNHVWLPDVIEAPTPVSALLHAGIVNAGGFLMLRFADLVSASELVTIVLLTIGGTSAVWGSLVMLTKSSVKEALAYSTVAQMGFMLFECALGAYQLAMLHIMAHSAYKAHAFLSAGQLASATSPAPGSDTLFKFVSRWLAAAALLVIGKGMLFDEWGHTDPGSTILLGIVASALAMVGASVRITQLGRQGRQVSRLLASSIAVVGLGCVYLVFEHTAERVWGEISVARRQMGHLTGAVGSAFALAFAGVAFTQSAGLYRRASPTVQRVYVWLKGDALARAWFERCWGSRKDNINEPRLIYAEPIVTKDAYQEL